MTTTITPEATPSTGYSRSGGTSEAKERLDEAQRQHPDGVRHRHRQAQAERVASPAAGAHQVGGHDRLAVTRGDRVEGTQARRHEQ